MKKVLFAILSLLFLVGCGTAAAQTDENPPQSDVGSNSIPPPIAPEPTPEPEYVPPPETAPEPPILDDETIATVMESVWNGMTTEDQGYVCLAVDIFSEAELEDLFASMVPANDPTLQYLPDNWAELYTDWTVAKCEATGV